MLVVSAGVLLLSLKSCRSDLQPKVSTSLGSIVAHHLISAGGNKYEAYEGIPYAKPPIGNKRFGPPEPADPWEGELTADTFPPQCIGHGRGLNNDLTRFDENCLFLSVYVPIRKSNSLLPVIVWIYGGGFSDSTLNGHEQRYLIDHDVIFVSINYRHGALGFLSTEDDIVPGNMGLKDQSLGLQWVHKNIKYFGGDSNKITLMGLSAGGASVHYHYLSPMSAGLFRGGISASGTAYECWAQTENSREKAIKLGRIFNCSVDDLREMIQCLRTKPALDIAKAQTQFMPWKFNEFTPFGPVVEKVKNNAFINRSPAEIVESGDVYDVPWVTSSVSEDGLFPVAEFITNTTALKEVNENWEKIAPHLLQYYYSVPKSKHAIVASKIRKHYLGDQIIDSKSRLTFTHLATDRIFAYDAQKAAKAQAKVNKSPVLFYYYSYRGKYSITETLFYVKGNLGVSHADDIFYALGQPGFNVTDSQNDFIIHKDLLNFIIFFASNGAPTLGSGNWQRVESKTPYLNYLHISGPGKYKMERSNNFAQKQFWDSVKDFNENKISIKKKE